MRRFVAPVAQRLRRCRRTSCELAIQPSIPEHDSEGDSQPEQCIATSLRSVLRETSEMAEQKLLQMLDQHEGQLMDEIWILHKQCAALVDENSCLRKVLSELDGNNGFNRTSLHSKIPTKSLLSPSQASAAPATEQGRGCWDCNGQELIKPSLLQECPLEHDLDGEVASTTSADMDFQWAPCPADEKYIALAASDIESTEHVMLQAKLPPSNWCNPLTTVPTPSLTQPQFYSDALSSAASLSALPTMAVEMLEQHKDLSPPKLAADMLELPTDVSPPRLAAEMLEQPKDVTLHPPKVLDADNEIRCRTPIRSGIFFSSIRRPRSKEVKVPHEDNIEKLQYRNKYETRCTVVNTSSESLSDSLDDDHPDSSRSRPFECYMAEL